MQAVVKVMVLQSFRHSGLTLYCFLFGFQWFCRRALWSSIRSSSSMERFFRPIMSLTGVTGSAGEPPSSCWVEASSSACGRTYTRMRCTEFFLNPRPHEHTHTRTHSDTLGVSLCHTPSVYVSTDLIPLRSHAVLLAVIFSQVVKA